jgi:hypothetical protein
LNCGIANIIYKFYEKHIIFILAFILQEIVHLKLCINISKNYILILISRLIGNANNANVIFKNIDEYEIVVQDKKGKITKYTSDSV